MRHLSQCKNHVNQFRVQNKSVRQAKQKKNEAREEMLKCQLYPQQSNHQQPKERGPYADTQGHQERFPGVFVAILLKSAGKCSPRLTVKRS